MTHFVVEKIFKGYPIIETITGVEDIDLASIGEYKTIFECATTEEVLAVENELRRRHKLQHEKECGK